VVAGTGQYHMHAGHRLGHPHELGEPGVGAVEPESGAVDLAASVANPLLASDVDPELDGKKAIAAREPDHDPDHVLHDRSSLISSSMPTVVTCPKRPAPGASLPE
jgi:hypothetical protein